MARYVKNVPTFKEHELIGASNLLRFALRYASGCPSVNRAKRVGLCVSGMTAGKCGETCSAIDLLNRTLCRGQSCLVLLGTNLLRTNGALQAAKSCSVRKSFRDLRKDINQVLRILQRRYEKVVFLTIPPIPAKSDRINIQIKRINALMLGWKQSSSLRVLPLHDVLCLEDGRPDTALFERFYNGNGKRPDGIHLNEDGLAVMNEFLRLAL